MIPSLLSFADLSGRWQEGVDFRIRVVQRSSRMLVLAPHGGGIEPGTSEIAEALAGKVHSLYCFDGLLDDRNWDLHLSSIFFDESRCLRLLRKASRAVAIHGCRGEEPVIWVGGLDRQMKTAVLDSLRSAEFDGREDTGQHAGMNPLSLCNRTQNGMGLQLEISLGQRQLLFEGLSRPQRRHPTRTLERFTRSIHTALAACL